MLGNTYEGENCSLARALEIVGERWSMLIMRDAIFRGTTRFNDFRRNLGIVPNVLVSRLDTFVRADLMYLEDREYRLTAKGLDLQAALIAMTQWGDRWEAPDGPPAIYEHVGCGGKVRHKLECAKCKRAPGAGRVKANPGPGAAKPHPAPSRSHRPV